MWEDKGEPYGVGLKVQVSESWVVPRGGELLRSAAEKVYRRLCRPQQWRTPAFRAISLHAIKRAL